MHLRRGAGAGVVAKNDAVRLGMKPKLDVVAHIGLDDLGGKGQGRLADIDANNVGRNGRDEEDAGREDELSAR
jgi:hypothetical protein